MALTSYFEYEKNYFINIDDAMNLIAKETDSPMDNIARYLINNLFHLSVPMYSKNIFSQFYLNDAWVYEPIVIKTDICKNTTLALEQYVAKPNSQASDFSNICKNYWLRYDFFNAAIIKDIGLFDDLEHLQTDNIYLEGRRSDAKREAEVIRLREEFENKKSLNTISSVKNMSTRERNNGLKIIAILVKMLDLPIDQPFVAFNMLEAYAIQNNLEIPSKDTVVKWLRDSNNL